MKGVSDTKNPEWVRFLVIGCGSIGKRHIENLRKLGMQDIIAFDVQSSRREEVRERFWCFSCKFLSKGVGI